MCGKCGQRFAQNDPAGANYEYKTRRPTEVKEGRRARKQDIECPPERSVHVSNAQGTYLRNTKATD